MNDPRLTLMLDGVAAAGLEGLVAADLYRPTRPTRCITTASAIRKAADAASEQQDQLVFGEAFDVLAETGGFLFGQARRDGYVGWVDAAALADGLVTPTHWVSASHTLAFERADLKSPVRLTLSMNSLVAVDQTDGKFAHLADAGWVASVHLSAMAAHAEDPAAVAGDFSGAPYYWGGRESLGLDCSGLVQQAHYACAVASARDTDMQGALGEPITADRLQRNDLVFWRGHVGLMLDGARLLHANAHHMATAAEPLADAVARIRKAGGGEPTGFRRVSR